MGKQEKRRGLGAARWVFRDGLPPEVAAGQTLLRTLNRDGCVIEGAYQMEAYQVDRILLRVGFGHLELVGRSLEIEQMEASLLSLRGELDRIEYRP